MDVTWSSGLAWLERGGRSDELTNRIRFAMTASIDTWLWRYGTDGARGGLTDRHAVAEVRSVSGALVARGAVFARGADVSRWASTLLHFQSTTFLRVAVDSDLPADVAQAKTESFRLLLVHGAVLDQTSARPYRVERLLRSIPSQVCLYLGPLSLLARKCSRTFFDNSCWFLHFCLRLGRPSTCMSARFKFLKLVCAAHKGMTAAGSIMSASNLPTEMN